MTIPQHDPLLWIKSTQIVLTFLILMFLVTYQTCGNVDYNCRNSTLTTPAGDNFPYKNKVCIAYPFRLSEQRIIDKCGNFDRHQHVMHVNFDGPAKFFLTITVMSMLVSAATVCFYIKFWDKYHFTTTFAFPDLIVTFMFAGYWLAATFSWGAALGSLKEYTSPEQIADEIKLLTVCDPSHGQCNITQDGWNSYGALNATILFGIVNICLWYANAWFVYRKIQEIKVGYETRFESSAYVQYPPLPEPDTGRQQGAKGYGSYQPAF